MKPSGWKGVGKEAKGGGRSVEKEVMEEGAGGRFRVSNYFW